MSRYAYSRTHQMLHWATFGLVLVQIWTYPAIGRTHHAAHLGESVDPADMVLHNIHAISGGLILLFALVRLWLRHRSPLATPAFRWPVLATLSKFVHVALYATLILLPITGVLKMYVLSPAGPVHVLLTRVLYVLLVLHISGAFLHAVVWKDDALFRMGLSFKYNKN